MLFATQPDTKSEMHQHLVEVDDQGNGMTDEAGNPPHVHEVGNGGVIPYTDGNGYTSVHPGPLIMMDDGSGQEDDSGDATEGQYAEAVESAIDALVEAEDMDAMLDGIVDSLLFEEI